MPLKAVEDRRARGVFLEWRDSMKARDLAGISDVTFHDIRGTAVTRLALAGCTVAEIASLTGHALSSAQAILDAHYLGGQLALVEAAIAKLEKNESGTGTVKRDVKIGLRFTGRS